MMPGYQLNFICMHIFIDSVKTSCLRERKKKVYKFVIFPLLSLPLSLFIIFKAVSCSEQVSGCFMLNKVECPSTPFYYDGDGDNNADIIQNNVASAKSAKRMNKNALLATVKAKRYGVNVRLYAFKEKNEDAFDFNYGYFDVRATLTSRKER